MPSGIRRNYGLNGQNDLAAPGFGLAEVQGEMGLRCDVVEDAYAAKRAVMTKSSGAGPPRRRRT